MNPPATVPIAPVTRRPPGERSEELDEVLRAVNRIRAEHGADALYELPKGSTAMQDGSCVLERAFEDLGVLCVDYEEGLGRNLRIEHGLGPFIRKFDRGAYPELIAG